MEGLQKLVRKITKESISENSSSFTGKNGGAGAGLTAALSSSDQSRVLVTRPPRQMVSLWTCSKLCAIFFVAGAVVGYTLNIRVRRWASSLLKRLKDD